MAESWLTQGKLRLICGNSNVPNWKPSAVGNDQNCIFSIHYNMIAALRAIVEVNAHAAVVHHTILPGPDRPIVGIGVSIASIEAIAGFSTVIKL